MTTIWYYLSIRVGGAGDREGGACQWRVGGPPRRALVGVLSEVLLNLGFLPCDPSGAETRFRDPVLYSVATGTLVSRLREGAPRVPWVILRRV